MKILEFALLIKHNLDCLKSIEEYLSDTGIYCLLSKQEMIEKNFLVKLLVLWPDENNGKQGIVVAHNDITGVMRWFKETHEEVYNLLPPLNLEEFEKLAKEMKTSSEISLHAVTTAEEVKPRRWNEPVPDDFVPRLPTTKESIDIIVKNGFYTRLQGYPHGPVKFFAFHGTDFQSLLDHVNKD